MERLTDKMASYINIKDAMSNVVAEFEDKLCYELNNHAVAAMVNKLKAVEDIMEKYDFESVEELDETLEDNTHAKGAFGKLLNQAQDLEHDRDTWKRACELVSKCCIEDNGKQSIHFVKSGVRITNNKELIDYCYNQAQKELKK